MARYLGGVKGRKGPGVTRLGAATTGITTDANGWNAGVHVHGAPNPAAETQDAFTVTLNGGSMADYPDFVLGELRETPHGRIFVLSDEALDGIRIGTNVIDLDR